MGAHAERMRAMEGRHRVSAGGSGFEVDPTEVLELFKDLTGKEQDKATRDALKAGARILQKKTRLLLRSRVNGTNKRHHNPKTGKTWKTMQSGVKVVAKSPQEVKVHIMGEFRLKWDEMGTEKRQWKRKGKKGQTVKTGDIKPRHFFKDAKDATERQIFDSMDSLISQSIDKIARRHASR